MGLGHVRAVEFGFTFSRQAYQGDVVTELQAGLAKHLEVNTIPRLLEARRLHGSTRLFKGLYNTASMGTSSTDIGFWMQASVGIPF